MESTDKKPLENGCIFHHMSAGATTIMPSGVVLRFGGSVVVGDHATKVGTGTYVTDNEDEIAWLRSVCKQPTPQIWEEVPTEVVNETPPAQIVTGVVAAQAAVTGEIEKTAVQAVNPAVAAALAKMEQAANGAAK